MKQELWQYSVKELIDGYKKKLFNSLEVSLSVINQIKSLNKKINAFVHFDEEMVIEQAKLSKNRWERDMIKGVLDGIPISVKDLIITEDYPTFRGSFNTSLPNKSEENAGHDRCDFRCQHAAELHAFTSSVGILCQVGVLNPIDGK